MRTVLSGILMGVFILLGSASSFANSPCEKEIVVAEQNFSKVMSRGTSAIKSKARTTIEKVRQALKEGDEKICHIYAGKLQSYFDKL